MKSYNERMIDAYHQVLRKLPTLTLDQARKVFNCCSSSKFQTDSMLHAQKRVIAKRTSKLVMDSHFDKAQSIANKILDEMEGKGL